MDTFPRTYKSLSLHAVIMPLFIALGILVFGSTSAIGSTLDLDAVFANHSFPSPGVQTTNRVCLGDGTGTLTCSDMSIDDDSSHAVALGFLDGDTNLDAVIANDGAQIATPNRVCLGDGAGNFSCSDVSSDLNSSFGVVLGLLNGDAHLDAVFSNLNQKNRVCFGDGAGGFTSCSDVSSDTFATFNGAVGFVDGDANLDIVFANFSSQLNRVCLGDGAGNFTCSDIGTVGRRTTGVALGFVDGDTNLDAIFANDLPHTNQICLGDGTGNFTCSDVSSSSSSKHGKRVELGFVDGDSNLDAIFANVVGQPNEVCLGNGAGGFTCSDIIVPGGARTSQDVALGDLDGDLNLDAVFANGFQANRACLGDGAGGFACSDINTDTRLSNGVALGFIDSNQPPVADAGSDQGAIVGNTVILDGNGSSDPDVDPLTFSWTILSKPAGSTAVLNFAASATPAFDPDLPGEYIVELVVNDGTINSPADTVTVTAITSANAVGDLVSQVEALDLQNNQLESVLSAAINVLDDMNQNNDIAAINSLQNFQDKVEKQRGDPLTNEEADALIAAAQEIIDSLT